MSSNHSSSSSSGSGNGSSSNSSSSTISSVVAYDPLRLTLCVYGLGMSGYEAAESLEQQHGIVPELATHTVSHI